MEGYLTNITMWAPNWSPRNWASCSGQTMPISSFNAVYSLIGTFYGGDGRTTFLLPDLRGRMAIGHGHGIGLTPRTIGQAGGIETVTLSVMEMPKHNHTVNTVANGTGTASLNISSQAGTSASPISGGSIGQDTGGTQFFYNNDTSPSVAQTADSISNVTNGIDVTVLNNGSSYSHNNMLPFQCVGYIICLSGIYPSRN